MQPSKHDIYIVHRQPVPLDSCVFCDADSDDSHQQGANALKNAFVVIHLTRYYQVISVYTLQTTSKADKVIALINYCHMMSPPCACSGGVDREVSGTYRIVFYNCIEKFQESIESYESIQLKDMLRCTPLFSSLSLRRSSSSRCYSGVSSPRQRSIH